MPHARRPYCARSDASSVAKGLILIMFRSRVDRSNRVPEPKQVRN